MKVATIHAANSERPGDGHSALRQQIDVAVRDALKRGGPIAVVLDYEPVTGMLNSVSTRAIKRKMNRSPAVL